VQLIHGHRSAIVAADLSKFIKNGVWSVAAKTRLIQLLKQQQHMINKIMTQPTTVDSEDS
jgi:hypothetical protein